ncbi:MAG: 1-acyl-sn-glycerol-3-phosphate acyltransferase [Candidatus Melainabacteria bacterium]|nr:1-acyl-sn-glycerol-3-phosphate acyltransferase [Candidatus Melainabacteria bacterium]
MLKRIEARLTRFTQAIFYFIVWSLFYCFFSFFCKIKIEGRENIPRRGRFILAGNHQNFFDGFFLSFTVNPFKKVSFVIAKRALKYRFYRLIARLIGSVLIGREVEDYQKALKKLNRILSHGEPVGIFPEGDVSRSNIPRKFKGGVAKLSIDSKTKVIPVYLKGTFNLRYFKYLLTRPEILITVGKPVELYNYATLVENDLEKMSAILKEKIIALSGIKEKSFDVSLKETIYSIPVVEPIANV